MIVTQMNKDIIKVCLAIHVEIVRYARIKLYLKENIMLCIYGATALY